jgi:hypothetical protein
MRNARLFLSTASAAIVLAGGLSLSTAAPAQAAARCSSGQVTYVQGVISGVCGSGGGTAIVVCDGANVSFESVVCN